MVRPLAVINAVHSALRADMAAIDAAALAVAQGDTRAERAIERFQRMDEVLRWHAEGEEASIFPAIETVAPAVVPAYEIDHRGLDEAFETLRAAVGARHPLDTARATAAFKFHLDLHLRKEDAHLYVLFEDRLSETEQVTAVGGLASSVPSDRYPDFMTWLFPLLGADDRDDLLAYWHTAMPPDVYERVRRYAEPAKESDTAEESR